MDALRQLVQALSTSAREVAPHGNVSGAQLFVLRQIAAEPRISIGELADRTLARRSSVSEVVARLVTRRLITRDRGDTDGRRAVLTLTSEGRAMIADVAPTAQEHLLSGLAALSPAQRSTLADTLEAWLHAAGLSHLTPSMFFESDGPEAQRRKKTSTST